MARTVRILLRLAWGASALGLLTACAPSQPAADLEPKAQAGVAPVLDWTRDDRLLPYVTRCPQLGHFNGDTSDMLPVLVSKLQNSTRDVLRNVREELAHSGEPGLRELDRLVRRSYGDRHLAHTIGNALGVIQLSPMGSLPMAQELLRSCLGHPQDTVRNAAIAALVKHAQAPLFDDMLALFPISPPETRAMLMNGLYTADPRRTERLIASWIEEASHGDLMEEALRLVAGGADAQTAATFAPLSMRLEGRRVRAFFSAIATRAPGASKSTAYLEELLASEDAEARCDALMALEYTERLDLVAAVLLSDPDATLRRMACGGLLPQAAVPVAYKALGVGLNDTDPKIREVALHGLLAIGDERAADTALELWGSSQQDIGIATRAIAGVWDKNPGLAQRAFKLLRERQAQRASEGLAHTEYLIQAIAQVPGPDSTAFLLDLARATSDSIKGFSGHRYLTLQASNTGPAGHVFLREAWRNELDPGRRFDLLWAGSLAHDAGTSQFLVEVLQAERSLPHERLWAAERLAREGPAELAAPLIKRATLRMNHRDFRPAMECLLWRWYGEP